MDMQKNKKAIGVGAAVLTVFFLFNCGPSREKGTEDAKILVVHSYHIEYPWTRAIDDGIMDVLTDKPYTIKKYFMDTKRNTDEDFKTSAGLKVLEIIKEFKPSVVITTDDNAQYYAGRYLVNKENISVVFCGVNAEVSKYDYPGNNVTGVRERPFIRSTLNLLAKIVPDIRTYTVFTDKSPTSSGFIQYLQELKLPIRIDNVIELDDFKRWKQELKTIESDAVITYMYHTVKSEGKPVEPRQVMEWTTRHLDKPSVGFFDFAVEDGVLLGHVESGFEHGELAAKKAIEIIKGKKAVEIPISTASKGLVLVNGKTAAALNIDISPIHNIIDKVVK